MVKRVVWRRKGVDQIEDVHYPSHLPQIRRLDTSLISTKETDKDHLNSKA